MSGEIEITRLSEDNNYSSAPAHSVHLTYSTAGPRNAKKNIWYVADIAVHCSIPL